MAEEREEDENTDDEPEEILGVEQEITSTSVAQASNTSSASAPLAPTASTSIASVAAPDDSRKRPRDDRDDQEEQTATKKRNMDGATAAQMLGGTAPADRLPFRETAVGDLITVTMQIPNEHVGAIIGRQGANIKMLRESSRTSIQIPKESYGNERDVIIEGMRSNVAQAQSAIERQVAQRIKDNYVRGVSSAPSGMSGAGATKDLHVPNDNIGGLIGRQGSTIKSIREQSGCQIDLESNRDLPQHATHRHIRLTGSNESIQFAERLIMAKLAELGQDSMHRGVGGRGGPQGPPRGDYGRMPSGRTTTQQASVPSEHVGRIIGKGGSMIKQIRERSGCDVQIDKESVPGQPTRVVTFTGTPEGISMAQFLVSQKLVDPNQQPGGYGQQQPGYGQAPPPPPTDGRYGQGGYGQGGYGQGGYGNVGYGGYMPGGSAPTPAPPGPPPAGGGYGYGPPLGATSGYGQHPPPGAAAPPPPPTAGGYGYGAYGGGGYGGYHQQQQQ